MPKKTSKQLENLSGSDDSEHSESEEIKEVEKTAENWVPSQLFVSGLPYETTEEQLKQFFGDIAKDITSIKLPKYQDTGRCLGYAHVLFSTLNGYKAALLKN